MYKFYFLQYELYQWLLIQLRLYSWWWACVPLETCRVDLQRNKTSLHIVTSVGYSIEDAFTLKMQHSSVWIHGLWLAGCALRYADRCKHGYRITTCNKSIYTWACISMNHGCQTHQGCTSINTIWSIWLIMTSTYDSYSTNLKKNFFCFFQLFYFSELNYRL